MNCKICQRERTEIDFCERHQRAYQALKERFASWDKALGISWKDYLSQVAENSSAGNWAKEVAKYLAENGETDNVK